jgi:putative MATE family efflux protein
VLSARASLAHQPPLTTPDLAPHLTSSSDVLRPIWRLAAPVLLGQVLNTLVGLVDMYLAGQFLKENSYLAAINLMVYLLWILPNMFSAVAIGATALVARFTGARQPDMTTAVLQQAFVLGIWITLPAVVVTYLGGPAFVGLMQLEDQAAPLAVQYLLILVPALPAMMIEQVGIACLHGAGDTVSEFVAKTLVNLANLFLSFALLTGWGPFPEMGFRGLALGTTLAHALGGAIILALLLRGRAGLKLRLRGLWPDWQMQRRLLRIGLPGAVDVATLLVCQLWFVAIVNSLGTAAAAAHGLGIRIESLAYLPGTAFQVAAASLTGQFLGAGSPQMARKAAWTSLVIGGAIMTFAGACFYLGSERLPALLVSAENQQARELTAPLLRTISLSMPALAITMVLGGALRGAGDTRLPLVITVIGFLGIRIPLAYWLTRGHISLAGGEYLLTGWDLGILGAWYAMVVDICFRSLLVLGRFLQGGWSRIEV